MVGMIHLAKAVSATKYKTEDAKKAAYGYAALLVIFSVAQLFTLEDTIELFEKFGLPEVGMGMGLIVALVIFEVFSLLFVLGMKISPCMRIVSMLSSVLVPTIWLSLSIWLNINQPSVDNIGFLGTVIDISIGWWLVFISIALLDLAIWVAWGAWPDFGFCAKKPTKSAK